MSLPALIRRAVLSTALFASSTFATGAVDHAVAGGPTKGAIPVGPDEPILIPRGGRGSRISDLFPWSETFSYSARGGRAAADAGIKDGRAVADAKTDVPNPDGYAYAEGQALADGLTAARVHSESGTPTPFDRWQVQRGRTRLEIQKTHLQLEAVREQTRQTEELLERLRAGAPYAPRGGR